MTREDVLATCAGLSGAVEDYPFGDGAAVFKVGGRMFASVSLEGAFGSVNLKCDPELAVVLGARVGLGSAWLPPEQAPLAHRRAGRFE